MIALKPQQAMKIQKPSPVAVGTLLGFLAIYLAFAFSPIPNLIAIFRTDSGLRPARLTICSKDFDVAAISSNRRWSA